MSKKKKIILVVLFVPLLLVISFFLVKYLNSHKISSKLPGLPASGNISEVVKEQIDDASKKARNTPSSDNLGYLAQVYHSSANYREAQQCYNLAIEKDNSAWMWYYYLGLLNMEMGDPEAAIDNFSVVNELNPKVKIVHYYIGQQYKNLGKYDLAEESFSKISSSISWPVRGFEITRKDHFPLQTYANFELARLYSDTDRTALAIETLNKLIQKNYLFGPAYRLLGNTYNLSGNSEVGEHFTIRANDFSTFSSPIDILADKLVLLSRSELYLLKKIDEAEMSLYSDWTLRLVNQGLLYFPENKYLISKAIKTFLWKKKENEAIGLIPKHSVFFSDSFSELKMIGNYFYQKAMYPQAIEYWEKALELRSDVEVEKTLALSYWNVEEKIKAKELLDTIFASNATNPDISADIAFNLYHIGEKEKALKYLKQLKLNYAQHPKTLKLSGLIAEKNGDKASATRLYLSSFEGDPKDLMTIESLGQLLFEQKMWSEYIKVYTIAHEHFPNMPELLEKMGAILIGCPDPSFRQLEDGIAYSERAFTHFTCPPLTQVAAGRNLAVGYSMTNQKQKALTAIGQTINISKRENVSADYLAKLEQLHRTISNM